MKRQLALIGLTVALTGCPGGGQEIPETIVVPEGVGHIVEVVQTSDAGAVTVDLGEDRLELPADAIELYGRLSEGNLILTGAADGRPWWAGLALRQVEDGDCYALTSSSAVDDGSGILFPVHADYGLRLEKSAGWDDSQHDREGNRYRSWLDTWCVDPDGRVRTVHEAGSG